MENNEISMFMDVKLDIHDKRPDSLYFRQWSRCEVKIEAIKCLPCFLRVTIKQCSTEGMDEPDVTSNAVEKRLIVSINIPGVTISLATSRTKKFSYGIFWTQSRKNCFIYFALETEVSCRRHMKWMKKSIKNLELYRQVLLEERRNSREPSSLQWGVAGGDIEGKRREGENEGRKQQEPSLMKTALAALGPLPKIPDCIDGHNSSSWSRRVSHVSDIYEEILEGTDPPRLSRRLSRSSIASGIYEEMKPVGSNFNAIVEENLEIGPTPPLPPLPPPRKRINTFETEGALGEIPRASTNPESELAKKKKYKNMLDNIFGSGRSKRAESVSETQTCTAEDLINGITPPKQGRKEEPKVAVYVNDIVAAKRQKKTPKSKMISNMAKMKRNSFSSPDLSKINFLDTFDEDKMADVLFNNSFPSSDELDLSGESLDESNIPLAPQLPSKTKKPQTPKADSLESLNISQQIPSNFNFSACNTSTVNLVGSNGAARNPQPDSGAQKNKILVDDLTGYCFMAPIIKKSKPISVNSTANNNNSNSTGKPGSILTGSSGYSTTGSHSSITSSSCTNSTEDQINQPIKMSQFKAKGEQQTKPLKEEESKADQSAIYEKMHGSLEITISVEDTADEAAIEEAALTSPPPNIVNELYENLLTVKAAQELESIKPTDRLSPAVMSTSTPTESPLTMLEQQQPPITTEPQEGAAEEESYYQTPRRSIISVDDKIPSYYPNSCEPVKLRRHSHSPVKSAITPTSSTSSTSNERTTTSVGLRQLVNMKIRSGRKENHLFSSPNSIIEQRHSANAKTSSSSSSPTMTTNKNAKTLKSKKLSGTFKITENVIYTVKHAHKKVSLMANNNTNASTTHQSHNNNNNDPNTADLTNNDMKERLQTELLQLAVLQKIDFKFDDTVKTEEDQSTMKIEKHAEESMPLEKSANTPQTTERVYENLLYKYTNSLWKFTTSPISTTIASTRSPPLPAKETHQHHQNQHHLQVSQTENTTKNERNEFSPTMSQSTKLENREISDSGDVGGDGGTANICAGTKKFASLPRFKKIDFSPLKLKINNVLQRHHHQQEF